MSKKRYILKIFILLFLILGCQEKKSITLELGVFAGSAWDTPNLNTFIMFDEIIDMFQESYPWIKITYKSGILKEDYSEWLSQKILKNREPDIFLVLPEDFTTFASIGILENLNDYLLINRKEGIYENIMKSGQQDGKQYGIPFEVNPTFMFVNKSLLDREGLNFPSKNWTWKEFLDYSEILTKDTNNDGFIDQYGVKNFNWTFAVFSNGETLFNKEGTKSFLNTPGVRDSCELLASIELLNKKGISKTFDSGSIAFEPNTYSTFRTYGYYPYNILKFGNFDWSTTLMPRGPNGQNAVDIKSLLIGISSRSREKKAASQFINFIINNRESQISILRNSKGLPLRKDVLYSEEARSILTKALSSPDRAITQETIIDTVENSIIVPKFRKYDATLGLIDKEIIQIPMNSTIIQNDLARLERIINEQLQK
ncbi:MAG: extracellular solute-binding protein [Spirochaetales bacterium]|nr:extracellular solute-binding protein [Spirochaetales bacterium]